MRKRQLVIFVLVLVLSLGVNLPVQAADITVALNDTATYLQKTVQDPQVGSIGGEWAILGLSQSDCKIPEAYYETYYQNVVDYVRECKGVLHKRKYTEYSRVVLALTAIDRDPTNVAGYDLVAPLSDYDKTVWQGVNGPIWALIALDSGNYPCEIRQKYIDYILEAELSGGGWSLSGDEADVDMTAMALQALAKYQDQEKVKAAINRALGWLSNSQNADGTFAAYGVDNAESCAQVVVALCELGIAENDSRFVKNGNSALDGLLQFYAKGNGFTHVLGGGDGADAMSTEQGFYALVAADRAAKGKGSLYRIKGEKKAAFSDIIGHENQIAIETLASVKIVNGMGGDIFAPNMAMNRAQFCAVIVKALGLEGKITFAFSDVPADAWYAAVVGAAHDQGLVGGIGNGQFNPEGRITRQDAAVILERAARKIGLDTSIHQQNSILAQFEDAEQVASYAQKAVAYCLEAGILTRENQLEPTETVLRGEMAQMIYNLMKIAGKL